MSTEKMREDRLMFSFLEIKVYKRKFILYVIVLFILCAVLFYVLYRSTLDTRAGNIRDESLRVFDRIQDNIAANVDDIEDYVLAIYGDKRLVQDMMYLLGSSMEEYMSKRLEVSRTYADSPSIVENIQEFASAGGQVRFKRISLHDDSRANVITFDHGQSGMLFLVPNGDPMFQPDISDGLAYTRTLASPNDVSTTMGELRFVMDDAYIFSVAGQYSLQNMAAFDDEGHSYTILNQSGLDSAVYDQILNEGQSQGEMSAGAQKIFYSVYTSSRYGFKIVSAFDHGYVFGQIKGLLLTYILGILVVYFCILMLLAINMRNEAEFLKRIIDTIGQAKTGQFEPVTHGYRRRNEYGMIAEELNDMCLKLDMHIKTEYLLKLKQQRTEMMALQHQINPHFLYNTLEIIRSFAVVNQDTRVADAITSLGKIYRGIVKTDMIISMEDELALLNSYLDIMAFRYNGKFIYQTEIAPSMREMRTVKFWMQPIAENFFTHGFDTDSDYNLLVLSGYEQEGGYVIEMMNNGKPIRKEYLSRINHSLSTEGEIGQESIGLHNVYSRLRYFYGDGLTMSIRNNKDAGITVTIHIPKEGGSDV
jgi:two-component system sensor histidine kinase YesM